VNELDDFMGGGASKTFQFYAPGDEVQGEVIGWERQQQTDMDTGQPKFFPNGQPRFMWKVTLQTNLTKGAGLKEWDPTEEDDGIRTVYLRWRSEQAVIEAIRKSGARRPELGAILTLRYAKVGPKQGNFNTKLYEAHWVPPDPAAQFMPDDSPPAQNQDNRPRTISEHQGAPYARPDNETARQQGQQQFGGVRQPGGGFADNPAGRQQWQRSSTLQNIARQDQPDDPPF
jgi:hypothetical protein